MAEEGGGSELGLATLTLNVDTESALRGLDAFQKEVATRGATAGENWAKQFIAAVEKVLGPGGLSDVTLPRAGGGGASKAAAPSSGVGSGASTGLGPRLREQLIQRELLKQQKRQADGIDELNDELLQPKPTITDRSSAAPDRLQRQSSAPIPSTLRADLLNRSQNRQLIAAINQIGEGGTRAKAPLPKFRINELAPQISAARNVGKETVIGRARGGAKERIDTRDRAKDRRTAIADRLDELERRGVNVTRLRSGKGGLGEITEALQARNFGTFNQQARVLERQVTLSERRLRIETDSARQQERLNKASQRNAPKLPVQGSVDIPGSPRARRREEQLNAQSLTQAARAGGARESITALGDAQKKRYRLEQQIRSLEVQGVETERLRTQLGQVTEAQSRRKFGTFRQLSDELSFQLVKERDRLKLERERTTVERRVEAQRAGEKRDAERNAPKLPVQGSAQIPGSPRFVERAETQRVREKRDAERNAPKLPVQGSTQIPGSPRFVQQQNRRQEQTEAALERVRDKQLTQVRRIEEFKERGISTSALELKNQQLTTAITERRVNTAQRLSKELSRAVVDQEPRTVARAIAEREALSVPVQGSAQLKGSPRFQQEQNRRQEQTERSLQAIREQQLTQVRKIEEFRQRGITTSDLELRNQELTTAITERRVSAARELLREQKALITEREPLSPGRRAAEREALSLPVRGSKTLEQSPAFLQEQARKAAVQRSTAQTIDTRIFNQQREITRLEESGVDVTKEKAQLQRAQNQLAIGEFDAAKATTNELARQLTLRKDNVGAEQRRSARQAKAQSAETSLTNLRTSELGLSERVNKLRETTVPGLGKVDSSAIEEFLTRFRQAINRGDLGLARKLKAETTEALVGLETQLARAQRNPQGFRARRDARRGAPLPSEPPRRPPLEFIPERRGAGLQRFAQSKGLRDAASSALIGGGFPLLFGQGVGASAGGLLGGAIGGAAGGGFGFGASIVGTIVGSAVDQLISRFGQLATALQDPIAAFDQLIEQALLASKAQEGYVQSLINAGREVEAAQIIRQEAGRTIDPAAAALLADAQDRYNRTISDAQDILGSFVAGPATEFLNFVSELVRRAGLLPKDGGQQLTGSQAVQDARGKQQFGNSLATGGALSFIAGLGLLATPAAPVGVGLTLAGLGTAAGLTGAGITSSGQKKEAIANDPAVLQQSRDLQALTDRRLKIELAINAAKSEGNKSLVESLQLTQQLLAIDEKRNVALLQNESARAAALSNVTDPNQRFEINAAFNAEQIRINDRANVDYGAILAQQQGLASEAERELAATQAIVGLSGQRLQDAQSLLEIQRAARERDNANQVLRNAQVELDKNPNDEAQLNTVRALKEAQAAAEAKYTQVYIQESEKRRQAAEAEYARQFQASQQIANQRDRSIIESRSDLTGPSTARGAAINQGIKEARQKAEFAQQRADANPNDKKLQEDARVAGEELQAAIEAGGEALQRNVRDAAEALKQAQEAYKGALESAFKFLTPEKKQEVLDAARTDIQKGVDARIIDPDAAARARTPDKIIELAGVARNVLAARDNMLKAAADLSGAADELKKAAEALQGKGNDQGAGGEQGAPIRQPNGQGFSSGPVISKRENGQIILGQAGADLDALGKSAASAGNKLIDLNSSTVDLKGAFGRTAAEITLPETPANFALGNQNTATVTDGVSSLSNLNTELAGLSSSLSINSDKLDKLSGKEWTVDVDVPGGNASGDILGAVNRGL